MNNLENKDNDELIKTQNYKLKNKKSISWKKFIIRLIIILVMMGLTVLIIFIVSIAKEQLA